MAHFVKAQLLLQGEGKYVYPMYLENITIETKSNITIIKFCEQNKTGNSKCENTNLTQDEHVNLMYSYHVMFLISCTSDNSILLNIHINDYRILWISCVFVNNSPINTKLIVVQARAKISNIKIKYWIIWYRPNVPRDIHISSTVLIKSIIREILRIYTSCAATEN